MRYYRVHDDMYFPGRWHLKMPVDGQGESINPWLFKEGKVVGLEGPIRIAVKQAGVALEFTQSLGVPVVHRRVVSLFERLGIQDEVQLIPVDVEGQTEPWFILNALQVIRCIDEARCEEVGYWLPEDERPDKVGQYKKVVGLKVDPAKVGAAHIFRPWGWLVVLIVSEQVKLAMEQEVITGTDFVEV